MTLNILSESALKFFGGARPEFSVNGGANIGKDARVITADPSNGWPTDRVILPPLNSYNRDLPEGGIHFAIFNMSGLNTLGIHDESDTLKLLLSANEGVYVSITENIAGTGLRWVFHNKSSHGSLGQATAVHPRPIFLHGQVAGPANSDTGEYFDYATKNYTTVTAAGASAIDHVGGTAAYGFHKIIVYLLGSTVSHTAGTDAAKYLPFTDTWQSWSSGSWYPASDSGGMYSGFVDANATEDTLYTFGLVATYGNYSSSTGSWTTAGTNGPTMFGGVSGELGDTAVSVYAMGASTDKWFECTRLDYVYNGFVRLAMMPANKRTGSGGYVPGDTASATFSSGFLSFHPKSDYYSPFTNTWASVKTTPTTTTGGPGGSAIGDEFYAFGGDLTAAGKTAFSYNVVTDSWTAQPDMNASRQSFEQQVASA